MLCGVSAARCHQPPATAESQISVGKSLPRRCSVRIPASKSTSATPSNADRIESSTAEAALGDFQKAPCALFSWALILILRFADTPETAHSSTHLVGSLRSGLARLGPLYGSNSAGLSAQPPPSAASSAA